MDGILPLHVDGKWPPLQPLERPGDWDFVGKTPVVAGGEEMLAAQVTKRSGRIQGHGKGAIRGDYLGHEIR